MWRRYRWPIVGVAVVVIAAAVALTLWLTSGSSTAAGLSITTVTVPVTTGTIQQTVASSGTLEPASQANLNFAVSGTVTAVNVKAGQTVTAGQVLATVDTTALSDDVTAAQAQLTAAEDRLASDEASGASTSQIDTRRGLGDLGRILGLDRADQSQRRLADVHDLGHRRLGRPDGRPAGDGHGLRWRRQRRHRQHRQRRAAPRAAPARQLVATGSGSSSGQIVVIGTDSYIVNTTVDDTQIGQIADGDQVDISVSGSGSRPAPPPPSRSGSTGSGTVYGTVGSISLIGSQTSDVTTFPVVIDVTGNPSGLYAGASANVSIIVKQLNNVTEVPTEAISYTHKRPGHGDRGRQRRTRGEGRDRRRGGERRDPDHQRRERR